MEEALDRYEAALEPERRLVTGDRVLARLLAPDCESDLFARWFLRAGAHGVYLSRHEGWRLLDESPGDRPAETGRPEEAPDTDAPGADTVAMLLESVHAAADWWQGRYGERPDVEALLATPPPAAAEFYVRLRENVVRGPAPYCGAAVDYEVARVLVTAGPALLENCRRVFGRDSGCCGFLAALIGRQGDQLGLRRRRLGFGLTGHPGALGRMTAVGKTALACSAEFLTECWDLARADLEAGGKAR
ncbi:hypothetical protein F5972_19235 [Microbispora cellulosiformans]|uniref:Uncharacterized protein n=1 Tax=Microbispora cellulosiformans TaxID=2614688 RepID=A0A5J5K3A9_9ACTN|nr:hypothetical protein [Microbispora cellulosiformans]KAA9377735.1 hypothetical protein F5972_19235 [Microbispora cellulosiformans]